MTLSIENEAFIPNVILRKAVAKFIERNQYVYQIENITCNISIYLYKILSFSALNVVADGMYKKKTNGLQN